MRSNCASKKVNHVANTLRVETNAKHFRVVHENAQSICGKAKMIHLANNHPVTTDSTRNLRGIADAHDGRRSAGHILGLKNGNTLLLKP